MAPCLPKSTRKRSPPARFVKSNCQLVCILALLGSVTQLCSMAIARFEAPAAPAIPKAIQQRAAVLIVGETRSLFLPRVYELCRRNLIGGLAKQGAAVDVFLRLDRSVKASEGSEGHRKISGARGVPNIVGHLPDSILRPMLETLKPVQVSWFVAGKDEGDTESDAGLKNGTLLPWRSLSIEERSLSLLRAFDRPLWSQWWNRYQAYRGALRYSEMRNFEYSYYCFARSDSAWLRPVPPIQAFARDKVSVNDVWMLTANDHVMVAPAGELVERLVDMDNTGRWWCFGNPYGLSPFHGRSNKEKKRPEAPCDYEAIRAAVVDKLQCLPEEADLIARDIVEEYCCSGARGKRFKTHAGHTEHLLAKKICGDKEDCGDQHRGFVDLAQVRLAQTVVRSHFGADCGRLASYQGNPSVRSSRPSVGNYLICVLLFHDCRFRDRRMPGLGPFGGKPLGDLKIDPPDRCAWPAWFPSSKPPEPVQLKSSDGRCVTIDGERVVLQDCVAEVHQDVIASKGTTNRILLSKPVRHAPDQLFALVANTDKGVEVLSLDVRFSSEFRCLRPGGAAGLTVGRCDALESGRAARETAFVFDAGRLIHGSGACVVGREQLSLSSCVAATALEVVVVEP